MSKKKKKNKVKSSPIKIEKTAAIPTGKMLFPWLVFLITFLLYGNTITHDYTQDDAIVIYDNMFTQKGITGIPGHLKNDTFYGFFKKRGKDKLVSGGRYRPLTPIMFSIERSIFGNNPWAGHLINVLLYAMLCVLIYKLIVLMLFPRLGDHSGFYLFAFLATLLFAAHPIHTEAVANIKGRDEIMSMMGAVLAFYYSLKYLDNQKNNYLLFAAVAVFLGAMAKETTITYLAVIPLGAYFFRHSNWKKVNTPTAVILVSGFLFIALRTYILGLDFGGTPKELMNNPYLKIVDNAYVPFTEGEKLATIIFTLGKYIGLLLFPHPLTHDYYPRHIDIMSFGNWQVLLSLFLYLGLGIFAILKLKQKSIVSFCILYFFITLSIVSNIVFPIGTNMSERFMFMPSLGFCILIAYLIFHYVGKSNAKMMIGIVGILLVAYSYKTFTRNLDWKNDFTLFTTDVQTSKNSAKVLNAAGGALVTESAKPENASQKTAYLDRAIPYLTRALDIHPNYKNASLLLGNAYYYKGDYEPAIQSYNHTLTVAPGYQEAITNLAIAYRDAGRKAGEVEKNLTKAKQYLERSIQLVDTDPDVYRLLGITHGMGGEHPQAIKYFTKVTEMLPDNASAFVNLGKAYQYYGDEESSRKMFEKAQQLDPKALEKN